MLLGDEEVDGRNEEAGDLLRAVGQPPLKIFKLPVASIELGPADLFSHLSSLMNAMAFWMSPRPTQRTPHQKPLRCDGRQLLVLDGVANDIREGGALDEVEDRQVS